MGRSAMVAMGVASLVLVPSLLAGQAGSFAGCYDVEMGDWLPADSAGSASRYLSPPPRIHLDTVHSGPWQLRIGPDAFVLRPAPGALPSIHRYAGWEPLAPDTVELLWTNGFSGMRVRLASTESGLEGMARSFWDFERKLQAATFVARPVDCSDPLPEDWVARWGAPRGFLLAGGDSLLLDEPSPPSVTTEAPLQDRIRLDVVPAGLMTGAIAVDVSLDWDGLVAKIWLIYPVDFDFEELAKPAPAEWGPPTSSVIVLDEPGGSRGTLWWRSPMNYAWVSKSRAWVSDEGMGAVFFMRRKVIPDVTTGRVPGTETPVSAMAAAASSAALRLWVGEQVPVNAQLIVCLGRPGDPSAFSKFSGLWSATLNLLGRDDLNVHPADQCSVTDEGVVHMPSSRPAVIINLSRVVWRGRDEPWITVEYRGDRLVGQYCRMTLLDEEWRFGECIRR